VEQIARFSAVAATAACFQKIHDRAATVITFDDA
jgi:hypothetical protein